MKSFFHEKLSGCNCNHYSSIDTDEGYLYALADFPIIGFKFRDLDGAIEHIDYTMGALECFQGR